MATVWVSFVFCIIRLHSNLAGLRGLSIMEYQLDILFYSNRRLIIDTSHLVSRTIYYLDPITG